MLEMPHHGSLRCVFKMIMGKYVHLYDFGKTCALIIIFTNASQLLGQGYVKERLKSSLRKFYGRYGDLTKQYEVPLSRMLHDILNDDHIQ